MLLKGAWYAAEQCGQLLHHAVILQEASVYPTAAAVALLAREELGLSQFLRDAWKQVVETGVEPDADEIRTACHDHVLKQRRSALVLTWMDAVTGGFGALTRKMFEHPVGSKEYEKAEAERDALFKRMVKRAPDERHSTRMRALYVDLKDSGTDWNRPADLTAQEATACVLHAVNDYMACA
jgi:AbiV family abortive infection protein